jgi:hypothetical protein
VVGIELIGIGRQYLAAQPLGFSEVLFGKGGKRLAPGLLDLDARLLYPDAIR